MRAVTPRHRGSVGARAASHITLVSSRLFTCVGVLLFFFSLLLSVHPYVFLGKSETACCLPRRYSHKSRCIGCFCLLIYNVCRSTYSMLYLSLRSLTLFPRYWAIRRLGPVYLVIRKRAGNQTTHLSNQPLCWSRLERPSTKPLHGGGGH